MKLRKFFGINKTTSTEIGSQNARFWLSIESSKAKNIRLLRNSHCRLARKYICSISIYNLSRLCATYVNRSNKRKWLYILKKARNRRHRIETITDADNADYQALLANIAAQAKSLLHSWEEATRGIRLCVNPDKAEFVYFKLEGDIFILKGKSLKLIDLLRQQYPIYWK